MDNLPVGTQLLSVEQLTEAVKEWMIKQGQLKLGDAAQIMITPTGVLVTSLRKEYIH